MGTHPGVLSESYPMNTNMTGLVLMMNVASALEGLTPSCLQQPKQSGYFI